MKSDNNNKKRGPLRSFLRGPRGSIVLSLAVIAVGLLVTVKACSSPVSHAGYSYSPGSGDTINVAIDYSPLSLYRYGDSLAGFNYEMMREMAAMNGVKVKFFPVASVRDALGELRRGKYDVVISDLPVTAAQKEYFRFTEPVYIDRQVLISRDSSIRSRLDLAGMEVWALPASPAAERLANLSREIGDSIHVRSDSIHSAEQLFMLTAMGKIDRAVINSAKAAALAQDYPDVDIATPVSFSQFQSWVVSGANPVLADTLDAQIRRFRTTAAYRALLRRYGLQSLSPRDTLPAVSSHDTHPTPNAR